MAPKPLVSIAHHLSMEIECVDTGLGASAPQILKSTIILILLIDNYNTNLGMFLVPSPPPTFQVVSMPLLYGVSRIYLSDHAAIMLD